MPILTAKKVLADLDGVRPRSLYSRDRMSVDLIKATMYGNIIISPNR